MAPANPRETSLKSPLSQPHHRGGRALGLAPQGREQWVRAAPGYQRDGEAPKQSQARKQHPERTRFASRGEAWRAESRPDAMPVLRASGTLPTSLLREKFSSATALVQLAPAAFHPAAAPRVFGATVVASTLHRSDMSYGMEQVQLDYGSISPPLVRNRNFGTFPRTLLNLTSSLNSGVIHKEMLPVLLFLLLSADSAKQQPAEESHHTHGTHNQATPGINITSPPHLGSLWAFSTRDRQVSFQLYVRYLLGKDKFCFSQIKGKKIKKE